jgi:hypothetical protein
MSEKFAEGWYSAAYFLLPKSAVINSGLRSVNMPFSALFHRFLKRSMMKTKDISAVNYNGDPGISLPQLLARR